MVLQVPDVQEVITVDRLLPDIQEADIPPRGKKKIYIPEINVLIEMRLEAEVEAIVAVERQVQEAHVQATIQENREPPDDRAQLKAVLLILTAEVNQTTRVPILINSDLRTFVGKIKHYK